MMFCLCNKVLFHMLNTLPDYTSVAVNAHVHTAYVHTDSICFLEKEYWTGRNDASDSGLRYWQTY